MIYARFLLPSVYGVLDACCKGKEQFLTHRTLLRLLIAGGAPEWAMIFSVRMVVWQGQVSCQTLEDLHLLFSFLLFFCSHIGMQISPIPGLEVMGAWSEAGGAVARQGWLGLVGLVGSPSANFDSSLR